MLCDVLLDLLHGKQNKSSKHKGTHRAILHRADGRIRAAESNQNNRTQTNTKLTHKSPSAPQ